MTDVITAISTAVTSVKAATDIAKLIKDADHSLEKAELNLKLADIIGALADARIALVETNDSVQEKDAEILRLQELLRFKENLVRNKEAYYEVNGEGKPHGAPYCQHCWEVNSLAVHLVFEPRRVAICPACKTEYQNYKVEIID